MATVHELAVAASINLENAAKDFNVMANLGLVLSALEEIAERTVA